MLKSRKTVGVLIIAVLAGAWFAMGPLVQLVLPEPKTISVICNDCSPIMASGTTDQIYAKTILKAKAESGDANAQTHLGGLYETGKDDWDYAQAAKWYLKAAEQGDTEAQIKLGELYERGEGVKRDYAEAYFWYSLGARQVAGDRRNAAAGHLTPEEKAATDKRVVDWKRGHPIRH